MTAAVAAREHHRINTTTKCEAAIIFKSEQYLLWYIKPPNYINLKFIDYESLKVGKTVT